MLDAAGVPFEAMAAGVEEEALKAKLRIQALSALGLAEALAERKALSIGGERDALVLGSDQTLELHDGSMLDKPESPEHAFEQLRSMSGKAHRLHSAAAVAEAGGIVWRGTETAALMMRPLSDAFLQDYLAREYEAIRRSVGGYHIEGRGVQLFERVEGSHFAILGMPLLPLLAFLRQRGILPS
jgi:septum formation protein